MISCQRHLFELPDDISYLNCAYTSPLLKSAKKAGEFALQKKSTPWNMTPADFIELSRTVRSLFSKIVGTDAKNIAIVPAVSYGIAIAAKNIPIGKDQAIVILQDQFPSNVYSWKRLATENRAIIKTVKRPDDDDWTSALIEAITPDVAIVAVGNCHWTDGTFIDLEKVGKQCRNVGAALVVDAIQSLGAMPFSIDKIQPDIVATGAHKWLMGPYSFGYCYIAPKWQNGVPLEENWLARAGSENFSRLVDYRDEYQEGALRFDVGEVSNFILSPIAAESLRQILDWGIENISKTLKTKTDIIAHRANRLGLKTAPEKSRSPHMIGISIPENIKIDLPAMLSKERVYVSVRGDSIRVSPHVYNTDEDIDRFFTVLEKCFR